MAVPAFADTQVEVLYEYKSWQVEGLTYDDGSLACRAEVTNGDEAFALYIRQSGTVEMEFYSKDWDFGESDTANLEVEIDRRGAWTLTGASLEYSSVYFDLTNHDEAGDFISEVARGSTAHLRTESGEFIQNYSLSGSSSSISKLIDCGNAIVDKSNPFK